MEALVKTDLYIYNSNKHLSFIDLFAIAASAYVDFCWNFIGRKSIWFEWIISGCLQSKKKKASLLAKLIRKLGKQKGYVCGSYL